MYMYYHAARLRRARWGGGGGSNRAHHTRRGHAKKAGPKSARCVEEEGDLGASQSSGLKTGGETMYQWSEDWGEEVRTVTHIMLKHVQTRPARPILTRDARP